MASTEKQLTARVAKDAAIARMRIVKSFVSTWVRHHPLGD
jgi:hypothetical protein